MKIGSHVGGLRGAIIEIADELALEGKGLLDLARDDPKWFYEHFLKQLVPRDSRYELLGSPVMVQLVQSTISVGELESRCREAGVLYGGTDVSRRLPLEVEGDA